MCRILILVDIRPLWGIISHAKVVFVIVKELLFKSIQVRCDFDVF